MSVIESANGKARFLYLDVSKANRVSDNKGDKSNRAASAHTAGRLPETELLLSTAGIPARGSMVDCDNDYRAAVVVRGSDSASVGIDAEPRSGRPGDVPRAIGCAEEVRLPRASRAGAPIVSWDRQLVTAKVLYGAWKALDMRWLDLADVPVRSDTERSFFRSQLPVEAPLIGGVSITHLSGRRRLTGIAQRLGEIPLRVYRCLR
jgi:hypothetical protein